MCKCAKMCFDNRRVKIPRRSQATQTIIYLDNMFCLDTLALMDENKSNIEILPFYPLVLTGWKISLISR